MSHALLATPLSRRSALRGTAMFGAGAAAMGLPFGQAAFAQAAQNWPELARWIDTYVRGGQVANMIAAVGRQEEAPDYVARGPRAFGQPGVVDQDTIYRIYSMTKPVTGIATMMLVEDGLITLDTPLADIIPAFVNMQVQRQYDGPITRDNLEPAERPITIRHLLTHTAGLGYNVVQQGPIQREYMRLGLAPGQVSNLELARAFFDVDMAPSLAEFAERLATLPLVHQPGRRWSYSVSLDLLGYVIELVSGQSFASFLQERIFTPCGMSDTGFRVPRADVSRLTTNYFLMGGMPLPLDPASQSVYLQEPVFHYGGAGLVSTARDYDRFLKMLVGRGVIEGTRVMEAETVRIATGNLFPDTLVSGGEFTTEGNRYGFGAGGLVGTGESAGLFGWAGAAGTVGMVHTGLELRMTLMTQYMPAESLQVQAQFPRIVLQDWMAMAAS